MGQLPSHMQSLFPAVTVRSGLGAAQSPAGPDQARGPLHRELLDIAPQLRQWCQAQLTHQFLRRHPYSLCEGRVREL